MSGIQRLALLDTNVLLLFLVGETDVSLLKTFKRMQAFEAGDLGLLADALRPFRQILTTPHVLAETSNFVDQAPLYRRQDLIAALRRFAERNEERFEAAKELMTRKEFEYVGLADVGLVSLSSVATVLTIDYRLAYEISVNRGAVVNFQHLRGEQMLKG